MQEEQEIREIIQRWHERTAIGDVDSVLALMTEDAIFISAGKNPVEGRRAFGDQLRTMLSKGRIESSARVEEVLVSGDLAFARTRLGVKVIPHDGSKPVSRSGWTLSVFHRAKSGAWLLKRDANLLVADAD